MVFTAMLTEAFEGTFLLVHGPRAFTQAEWDAYLEAFSKADYLRKIVMVDPSCPQPTRSQRAAIVAGLRKKAIQPHIALLTQSSIHRGVVTVVRWLHKNTIAAYDPHEVDEAMAYAEVPVEARGRLLERLRQLAHEVGSTWATGRLPAKHN